MAPSPIFGIALVFILLAALGILIVLRQNEESADNDPARQEARERGLRRMQEHQEFILSMYEDFVREQLERERELRRAEHQGTAILSMTGRPFQGKPLPRPDAPLQEIIRTTGIRPPEEVDFLLFNRKPHQAILWDYPGAPRPRRSGPR